MFFWKNCLFPREPLFGGKGAPYFLKNHIFLGNLFFGEGDPFFLRIIIAFLGNPVCWGGRSALFLRKNHCFFQGTPCLGEGDPCSSQGKLQWFLICLRKSFLFSRKSYPFFKAFSGVPILFKGLLREEWCDPWRALTKLPQIELPARSSQSHRMFRGHRLLAHVYGILLVLSS